MNDELRRSLDRAAGDDPQIDLTESAWAGGRVVRRRRHAAQAVGGVAAAAVLAGAFALGGGVPWEPNAYDGPARPTVDDTASGTVATITTTERTSEQRTTPEPSQAAQVASQEPPADTRPEPPAPVPTATTQEPKPTQAEPEPTTRVEPDGPSPVADGVLTLGTSTIEGIPLDGPVEDVVAAVSAELGEPVVMMEVVALDCRADTFGDMYTWGEVFEVVDARTELRWGLETWKPLSVPVDLPGSLELGQTAEEVRSSQTVVRETTDLNANTVLELQGGVTVFLPPGGGGVFRVVNPFFTTC